MISLPQPAYDLSPLRPGEIPLWLLVIAQFRLPEPTDHGASHWLNAHNQAVAGEKKREIHLKRELCAAHDEAYLEKLLSLV